MGTSSLITLALIVLMVLSLPTWKYTKLWGGTYTPTGFLGFILAAHIYTVFFSPIAK